MQREFDTMKYAEKHRHLALVLSWNPTINVEALPNDPASSFRISVNGRSKELVGTIAQVSDLLKTAGAEFTKPPVTQNVFLVTSKDLPPEISGILSDIAAFRASTPTPAIA